MDENYWFRLSKDLALFGTAGVIRYCLIFSSTSSPNSTAGLSIPLTSLLSADE